MPIHPKSANRHQRLSTGTPAVERSATFGQVGCIQNWTNPKIRNMKRLPIGLTILIYLFYSGIFNTDVSALTLYDVSTDPTLASNSLNLTVISPGGTSTNSPGQEFYLSGSAAVTECTVISPLTVYFGGISPASGNGAAAVAHISNGKVSSVTLRNGNTGGSGYQFATTSVILSGGGGSGAVVGALVYDTNIGELVRGVITSFVVLDGGSGYTSPPKVTILGFTPSWTFITNSIGCRLDFTSGPYNTRTDPLPPGTYYVSIGATWSGDHLYGYQPITIDGVNVFTNSDGTIISSSPSDHVTLTESYQKKIGYDSTNNVFTYPTGSFTINGVLFTGAGLTAANLDTNTPVVISIGKWSYSAGGQLADDPAYTAKSPKAKLPLIYRDSTGNPKSAGIVTIGFRKNSVALAITTKAGQDAQGNPIQNFMTADTLTGGATIGKSASTNDTISATITIGAYSESFTNIAIIGTDAAKNSKAKDGTTHRLDTVKIKGMSQQ